ncbi:MAG: large subunit ribosomal protein L24 [Saprospiraceae bacterium]|jgi:large subunit ribosomal protein L24
MSKKVQQQKRFAPKLKIKKGDKVVVIAGADKGSEGEVLEVFPAKNRVIVEAVNIVKKHSKPTGDNPGGINEIPASIHISNLKLVDPKTGNATRVGRRVEDGKIVRYAKSTGDTIR